MLRARSQSAKYAGPSLGEKRKMATGRIGTGPDYNRAILTADARTCAFRSVSNSCLTPPWQGPNAPLVQVTRGSEPVRRGIYLAGKPDALLFARDIGGHEQTQLYRLNPGSDEPVLLTDPARRHDAE